jgi:Zn2+/Cd2+-exporting ATPase
VTLRSPLVPVLVAGTLIALAWVALPAGPARDATLLLAALVAGAGVVRRAVLALRRGHVGIEALVAVAALGAVVIGEHWEAAAVTFLFGLGHALEARAMGRTRRAVAELLELLPDHVRVLRGDAEVELDPSEVRAGDLVVVRPGERVPVDGRVERGRAAVDESTLTGESMPVDKGPGDAVATGTSAHGYLEVRAEAVGADTTLARVVHQVEAAQEARPARQRAIERFARFYTPAVVLASALAFALTRDAHMALTLLVIACPGALVIATPIALVAGIGRSARDGVLIKGGDALERFARTAVIAFDKTGTLTLGRPRVSDVVLAGGAAAEPPAGGAQRTLDPAALRLVALAARAETGSEHPLALALRAAAGTPGGDRPDEVETVSGGGASATIDGATVVVGSPRFLDEAGVRIAGGDLAALDALRARGSTVAGVARGGRFEGWIGFADAVRPHAADALADLRALGARRLVMLTGDHALAAAPIADGLGIDDVRSGLLPGDKAAQVAELGALGGVVAMVGDGVNDAPALARADVGVAMGVAGTRVALEAAPVALMRDDLRALAAALATAQRTMRVVRQNLAIALGTVAILAIGVLAGHVHMALGMLVHQGSVLLVVINALRLTRSQAGSAAARRPAGSDAASPSHQTRTRSATASGSLS